MNRIFIHVCWRFVVFCALMTSITPAQAAPIIEQWAAIQESFFPNASVQDAGAQISINAPEQAENAAIVPFSLDVNLQHDHIKSIHLFTDANPILHTATFNLPQHQPHFSLATRIRLEKNSIVRVIVETTTDKYLMQTVAIKTPGGGCGGGAMTNEAKLRAEAGKMKIKFATPNQDGTQPFVLLIKHPMRTGFERTFQGYYAKAWFMEKVQIKADGQLLIDAKLGPGISADPYFKFGKIVQNTAKLTIQAMDNEGKVFVVDRLSQ